MYKNRELFYLNTISDGRLTVLSLLKEMMAIFSTPLYIEVSVEKNYSSKLIGNIEYAGGFPNRSIASNTIKKSAQLFKKKLSVSLKSDSKANIEKTCNELKAMLIKNYYAIYFNSVQGGIIINGRKSNKSLLRKDKFNISAGFSWQMPAEVDKADVFLYKLLPFELAPIKIKEEIYWHLSARADLFQQLIAFCDSVKSKVAVSFKNDYAGFFFEGNCTDLMLALSVVYGAGKITDEKGAPIDYDTWLAANLRWMNLSPKNVPDLKDQVLTMETKKQEGKVNKWFLKGISTLSND
jgi:hypothetical protein